MTVFLCPHACGSEHESTHAGKLLRRKAFELTDSASDHFVRYQQGIGGIASSSAKCTSKLCLCPTIHQQQLTRNATVSATAAPPNPTPPTMPREV